MYREPLKRVEIFTCMGSTLAEDGEFDAEVTQRAQSEWKNWNRVSICCGVRQKSKHEGEDAQGSAKLEVAEIRMIRWMCGVAKLDKIRHDRIRWTTKVGGWQIMTRK